MASAAYESAGSRAPRVVLFTKTDLTHLTEKEKAYFTKVEMDGGADAVIWGTANNYLSDTVQNDVIDQIKKTVRRWRSNQSVIEVIITGIPNTGKSTLINNLRRAHVDDSFRKKEICEVGDSPAVTRKVSERIMVCNRPKIYVQDTPGILPMSKLQRMHQVRLAAANLFPIEHIPHGYVQIVDYQLFCFNQRQNWRPYMEFAGLSLPTDNVHLLLSSIGKKYGLFQELREYAPIPGIPKDAKIVDKNNAATLFFRHCQNGKLGPVLFEEMDHIPKKYQLSQFDQMVTQNHQ